MRMKSFAVALSLAGASGFSVAQSTTLNVSSWLPSMHPVYADMLVPWCKDLERETTGKVKCNFLPKPVVVAMQTIDAVRDGLADVSFTVHGYTPGRFPLSRAVELPFMGDTAESMSVAWQRIYSKHLAKHEETPGVIQLSVFTQGPGVALTGSKPITSVNDFSGLKMRMGGGVVIDSTKALGVVPLLRPSTETYELISSGIADGALLPKETVVSLRLEKIVKFATVMPGGLFNHSFALLMNKAKFDQLGKSEQEAVMKLSGEAFARRAGKAWDAADARGQKAMEVAGIKVHVADDKLSADIKAKVQDVEKHWIENDAKSKGVDGAEVLRELRKEIAAEAKGG